MGDASPAADNDNEEGASPPPLPLALVTGANTAKPQLLMVHADHLGRPVRLTDATRATVWSASYDPFGQPVTMTGTVDQNLRFPGQYFLIETGLSYNWHRLYDPATGRYTQPDPLRFVDGPSVYGYAGQSPLMRVDPEGLAIGDFPPPPPGYDPTWKCGSFPNGRPYLIDPYGRIYIPHREDKYHWRHWGTIDTGGKRDREPPNAKKPWPSQKRPPQPDQSAGDPNGDAPPWNPNSPYVPFIPVMPIPSPSTPMPVWPIVEPPIIPVIP